MATTGDFSSSQLLSHEEDALLPAISIKIVKEIGELASALALERKYPITISIEINSVEVFRAALPGSSSEHDSWITRKARVVNLTGHSTMYERVKAEEDAIDWHERHGVEDATHAIHGGGFPLVSRDKGFEGVLLISGLPQVEDHLFAVEVLSTFYLNKVRFEHESCTNSFRRWSNRSLDYWDLRRWRFQSWRR